MDVLLIAGVSFMGLVLFDVFMGYWQQRTPKEEGDQE